MLRTVARWPTESRPSPPLSRDSERVFRRTVTGLVMPIARTGRRAFEIVQDSGRLGLFLAVGLARIAAPPCGLRPVVRQLHFIGARSTLVVLVAGTFVGMVVALQFHDTLVRFG